MNYEVIFSGVNIFKAKAFLGPPQCLGWGSRFVLEVGRILDPALKINVATIYLFKLSLPKSLIYF